MERRKDFYLYKMLRSNQDRAICIEMEKNYLNGFYYKGKGAKNLSEKDIIRIFTAFYFANPERIVVPLNDVGVNVDIHTGEFEIVSLTGNFSRPSQVEYAVALKECELLRAELYTLKKDFRGKIVYLAKIFSEQCIYYLGKNYTGEFISDLLGHGGNGCGYCTGIARTTAAILPVYCVRVKSKKETNGMHHIVNAFYDEGSKRFLFFDMTTALSIANRSEIEREIVQGYYRKDYSDGDFRGLDFYTLEKLKDDYFIEDEQIWK